MGSSRVVHWRQLDLGCCLEPCNSALVPPFIGRQSQNSTNDFKCKIDRLRSILTSFLDKGPEVLHKDVRQRQISDEMRFGSKLRSHRICTHNHECKFAVRDEGDLERGGLEEVQSRVLKNSRGYGYTE